METPEVKYLKDYRPPAYLVDTIDMNVELKEIDTVVTTTLNIRRNPETANPSPPLVLDGRQMDLTAIKLDGNPLPPEACEIGEETLTIPDVPDAFTLHTSVVIQPQENAALSGLYKSDGMFCTQCEAEGFRKITYFPDRPDVMAKYTCTIIADKASYPVLLANGNRIEGGNLPDGRHWVQWEDPFRKPSYLFALVAGDLVCIEDTFRTRSGRDVDLQIYVEHANADKCDYAMAALKKSMRWDEETFGREYDLDIYMIVAVNDFNMGAMENKGLNIFNSKFVLARPETATDIDFWNIDRVVAHEYFHNWTGNRVTLRNWFQLSLKEGLTVFRDQEFTADITSRPVKRISDVRTLRAYQFPEDAGPMAHPVRPASYIKMDNFYTVTVYEKGSEVIRLIQTILGREGFRKGMDLYFERYDGQAVSIEDFVGAMADANDADLDQFMRWYEQAGTPEISADWTYNPDAKSCTLTLRQQIPATPDTTEEKQPMHIPVAVGLLDRDGNDILLQMEGEETPDGATRVLNLRKPEETYTFVNVPDTPVPSLLRNFSAPVRLNAEYTDEELSFRFAYDSDPFNRWDAGQQLFSRIMLRMVKNMQQGKPLEMDSAILVPFKKTLLHPELDKSFIAHALTLPGEAEMGIRMSEKGAIDPDAIHEAWLFMATSIAGHLKDELETIFEQNQTHGAYTVDPPSVGRRSLKNLAMAYLGRLGTPEIRTFLLDQYRAARNMTEKIAALAVLSHIDCPERSTAIELFYEEWKSDVLVLDKWFSIQAASQLTDTVDRVKMLLDHPAFSIRNPNKVRALIGAFCSANPWQFHQSSGKGYAFLGDRVLEIDRFNPQIASRMVAAFNHWRKYDPDRQALMKAQLERILNTPELSRNVYEIVSRAVK